MSDKVRLTHVLSSLIRRFRLGARLAWNKITGPISTDEDTRRKEHTLNILLVFSNIILWILYATVIYNHLKLGNSYNGVSPLSFTAIALYGSVLLILSRFGFIRTSSLGLIGLYFVGATYGALHWGADMQMVILSYVIVILVSFILESMSTAIIISSVICVSIVLVWHLELTGVIAFDETWRGQLFEGDVYEFVTMFIIIITVAWLGRREITRSLIRARSSERALRIERDMLEIRVEERTTELKKVQAEKISELYRFAEFGRLSAGIFHDISSPLTALSMSVDRLKTSNERSYRIEDDIERITKASNKLGELVRSMRKVVSQKEEEKKRFCVNEEIREVCDLLTYKARMHNVKVSIYTEKRSYLFGTALRFHQAILNLVSNALDALEHTQTGHKQVHIKVREEKEMIHIDVEDNGSGIPKEIQEKIFDPFFTTKSASKGTGIGLSQTKNIIEREFNGTISVTSVPGTTCFTTSIKK